eukprot:gene1883-4978_t
MRYYPQVSASRGGEKGNKRRRTSNGESVWLPFLEDEPPLNTKPFASTFGCPDTLRHGPTSVRAQVASKHPVEVIQMKHEEHHDRLKLSIMGAIQGPAAPRIVKLERALLSQNKRLPGLHSSRLGLEVSTGRLGLIEFEDFLNDPKDSEAIVNIHELAEASPNLFN